MLYDVDITKGIDHVGKKVVFRKLNQNVKQINPNRFEN